jgi:3-carboxy-cis,cis-muconate cycloisomerase
MPHKRNPVLATEAKAAADRAHALVPLFLRSLTGEHQRPLASWHAEWSSIAELVALAGGAVARGREVAEGLTVDVERMAANLAAYGQEGTVDVGASDALIDRALAAHALTRDLER